MSMANAGCSAKVLLSHADPAGLQTLLVETKQRSSDHGLHTRNAVCLIPSSASARWQFKTFHRETSLKRERHVILQRCSPKRMVSCKLSNCIAVDTSKRSPGDSVQSPPTWRAPARPNTNGSQFFVCTGQTPHLDGKHVVSGTARASANLVCSYSQMGQWAESTNFF